MSTEYPRRHAGPVTIEWLMQLLEEASGGTIIVDRCDVGAGSIGRLQVSSSVMVAYLVAIEDELSFVWDDGVAPTVFDSFQALAAFLHHRFPASTETPCG